MELLNLKAIPIAYERRAYNITPKELNIIKIHHIEMPKRGIPYLKVYLY